MAPHTDPRCIHAQAVTRGVLPTPQTRAFFNNLITLYSAHDLNSSALRLFRSIPCPNTVTWTAVISAFSTSPPVAFALFLSMLRHPRRTLPNARTLATLLKTCASSPGSSLGQQLHSLSHKLALHQDPYVGSALVSFYCKARDPDSANKVFDEMSETDRVCFSALINGLAKNSRPIDALRLFSEMRRRDVPSTFHSVSGALSAASKATLLDQCMAIHGHAVVIGLDSDVYVGTALIDMYGKCGVIDYAGQVFDGLVLNLNAAGWNALIAGHALLGSHEKVVGLFRSMEDLGLEPDEYTFLAVLTAFYNAGLVRETETWLNKMKVEYGIEAKIEHYTCLVGALGRAGRLEEAERVAMTMPHEPDAAMWRVLLSSCATNKGNHEIGWRMAGKLLEIDPNDDSAYVILANVLARDGKFDGVKEVWRMMREKGVRKEVGRSWVEVRGRCHVFISGDVRHFRKDDIFAKLKELMVGIEKLGYVPKWEGAPRELEEREKREILWSHSEKLAAAFGLLSGITPPGKPLRITKNLRICGDCHEAFKYMCVVAGREIIVRDVHRYHRFLNGSCCCGDSW
ncbi:pentatricopeptide repeat-containing protein [Striga asiatica]|uniref:Pentatricopeptide repeat-containing protein n=1 Tax=Striga asiatica TaxID=4170 RepID=A0A5A7QV56_STRAF|nr:pentatricopeptide repeat-containing protein [Striga asiatica]